jgi:hypothetical protein
MLIEQNSYLTAHELINFWLPLVMAFGTLVGLIVRGWLVAKKGVSKWANTILNNQVIIIDKQLGHLQETTDKASTAVVELAKFHKDMLESQRGLVVMQSSLLATMIDMRTTCSYKTPSW